MSSRISRRKFLASSFLATLFNGMSPAVLAAMSKPIPWRNWSGNQYSEPSVRFAPADEDELVRFLKRGKSRSIRPVGAGHSFSALVPTDGTLMVLDRMAGLLEHDRTSLQATFAAGTRMADMGERLKLIGQALFNMADIDRQTLAGAVSTGTHGTGAELNGLPAYVTGIRLVTPNGEVLDCDANRNSDVFQAARVSLGSLGFITRITMQNRKPYLLKERAWVEKTESLLANIERHIGSNRHFEIAAILPHCDYSIAQAINETEDAITGKPLESYDAEGNSAITPLLIAANMPIEERRPFLNAIAETIEPTEYVDYSYKILPNVRSDRFNEMEFQIPAANGLDCIEEVLDTIHKKPIDIVFPIEFRYIKGDDVWLSMFEGGDRYSISVHNFWYLDYKPYFREIEKIFRKHKGRPHWGKLHTHSESELAALYPRWDDFNNVRRQIDPKGVMLNKHLRNVFGS